MKIWFNKVDESRRSLVEVNEGDVRIGRDADNTIVLKSPLVSRHHAVVSAIDGGLRLENVGLNSCLVGETEVLGGESVDFAPGIKVRVWPYTLTFDTETSAGVSLAEVESHLRSIMADLELRIHRQLLERLDLYELETNRVGNEESILLLEKNIEDVCRELNVFGDENDSLLEELSGMTLRDHLINQLIMETGRDEFFDLASLTANEFDVPATLVPERETELHSLLQFLRDKLELSDLPDISSQVRCVEEKFNDMFHLVRPHLHKQLRRYLILRTLKKDLKDTVFGFGPLQDLIRAPTITEIMVVDSDKIYVERDGVIERSGRRFISDKVTESIIERIVAQVGRRIDKSQPLVDARLPDGSRVNAIIPPLATEGPCLTIRKFPIQRLTMDDLMEMGSISKAAARFLRAAVVDRRNILVSGGTGTGKTTMLNILSSFIPNKDRVVTIEDTKELRLHQEHVVSLESKPPSVEGTGEYTIRDLVKNALRMRPDRVVVGECRGGEALDMIQAMNTGHDGSLTTVHANSAEEVIERLEVLILMSANLPIISIHRQIASAIDLVVHITRLPGGRRVVTQVSEVTGLDPQSHDVIVTDIFNFRDGKTLRPTGYLPSFLDDLMAKGLLELEFLYGRDEEEPDARQEAPSTRLAVRHTVERVPSGEPTPSATPNPSATPPPDQPSGASPSSANDGAWYCQVMGQELGPMKPEDMEAIYRAGQLSSHDLVRQGDGGRWIPAESTTLFQSFQERSSSSADAG